MLIPGKFKHCLITGGICTKQGIDELKAICDDVVSVQGTFEDTTDEYSPIQKEICGYKITLMNGDLLMAQSTDSLLIGSAHLYNPDIMVYGGTHEVRVEKKDGVLYLNPGSLTGAFSPCHPDNCPSFIVLGMKPEEVIVFTYQVKNGKLEVGKSVFKKERLKIGLLETNSYICSYNLN